MTDRVETWAALAYPCLKTAGSNLALGWLTFISIRPHEMKIDFSALGRDSINIEVVMWDRGSWSVAQFNILVLAGLNLAWAGWFYFI